VKLSTIIRRRWGRRSEVERYRRVFGTAALDPVDVFLFVGVGESGEGLLVRGGLGEGGFEVGGDGDGARGVVEGEFDVDGVAGRCAAAARMSLPTPRMWTPARGMRELRKVNPLMVARTGIWPLRPKTSGTLKGIWR
jgi:hypothetical protein